jgi:hypothetical protein
MMKPRRRKAIRYGTGRAVVRALRRGQTLHCQFEHGVARWRLSNGTIVSPAIIKRVLSSRRIAGSGDGLFSDLSQTYVAARLAHGPVAQNKCATTEGQTTMGLDMSKYVKKFIRLSDVKDGPLTKRIARVEEGRYNKPDLIFDTGESLSLNVTNILTLQEAYGTDADDWIGKKIELYEGEVTFEEKLQAVVLVRPISPGLTLEEKLTPVAAKAAAKPVGKDKADNRDIGDDIPF